MFIIFLVISATTLHYIHAYDSRRYYEVSREDEIELNIESRVVQCGYGGFFNGTSIYWDREVGDIVGIRMHCSRGALLVEGIGRIPDTYVFGLGFSSNNPQNITLQSETFGCNFVNITESPVIQEKEGLYYIYNYQFNNYNYSLNHTYQDAINGLIDVQLSEDSLSITDITFACFPYAPNRLNLSTNVDDLYTIGTDLPKGEITWGCDMSQDYFDEVNQGQRMYRVLSAVDITFEQDKKLWGIGQRGCRDIWPREPECMEGCGPHSGDEKNQATWQDPFHVDYAIGNGCHVDKNRGWYDALCRGYPHDYCKYVFLWHEEVEVQPHWFTCTSPAPIPRLPSLDPCRKGRDHSTGGVFEPQNMVDPKIHCQDDNYISFGWMVLKNQKNGSFCLLAVNSSRVLKWEKCPDDWIENFGFWFRYTKDGLMLEAGVYPGMCVFAKQQDGEVGTYKRSHQLKVFNSDLILQSCTENMQENNQSFLEFEDIPITTENWTYDAQVLKQFLRPLSILGLLENFTYQEIGLGSDSDEVGNFYVNYLWNYKQILDINYDMNPVDLMIRGPPYQAWGEIWSDNWGRVILIRATLWGRPNISIPFQDTVFKFKHLRALSFNMAGMVGTIPELNGLNLSGTLESLVLNHNYFTGSLPYDWPFSPGFKNLADLAMDGIPLSGPIPRKWTLKNAFATTVDTPTLNRTKIKVNETNLCVRRNVRLPPNYSKAEYLKYCDEYVKDLGDVAKKLTIRVTLINLDRNCTDRENVTAFVQEVIEDTSAHLVTITKQRPEYMCSGSKGTTTVTLFGKGAPNNTQKIQRFFNDRIRHMRRLNELESYKKIKIAVTSPTTTVPSPQIIVLQKDYDANVALAVALPIVVVFILVMLALFLIILGRKGYVLVPSPKTATPTTPTPTSPRDLTSKVIDIDMRQYDQIKRQYKNLNLGKYEFSSSDVKRQTLESDYITLSDIRPSPYISSLDERAEDFVQDINVDVDNDLVMDYVIGSGSFGIVYKAQWKTRLGEWKTVAAKVLNTSALKQVMTKEQTQKIHDAFYEEINIMMKLKHPAIVRFYGACLRQQHLTLLMEYMDRGTLEQLLYDKQQGRELKHLEQLAVLEAVTSVLSYLHPDILHKDIQPSSVLLNSQGHIKLSDFGLSQIKSMDQTLSYQKAIGTPAYLPPEVWTSSVCTAKSDIYQLGMLAWEVCARSKPWSECEVVGQIVQKVVVEQSRPQIPRECSGFMKQFMRDCWKQDPEERPNASDLLWSIQQEIKRAEQ